MREKIVFMDGFDSVRDAKTQSNEIFSTILSNDLKRFLKRDTIPYDVIDKVVIIYNSGGLAPLDDYLLYEGEITQDEREIIIESLWAYENP